MNLKISVHSILEKLQPLKYYNKYLLKAAKIIISIGLLVYVFNKVPFKNIWNIVTEANLYYLFFALNLLLVSQIISSARLLLFFKTVSFNLAYKSNLKLYFIGMFYNFFIPGGIGGDAYKIYLLHKKFDWKIKTLTAAVLFDRLNGLVAICIWILILSLPLHLIQSYNLTYIIPILIGGGYFTSKILFKKLNATYSPIFNRALLYSLVIQGLQILCIYFILLAVKQNTHIFEYIIVFLTSVVLSIVSFSGIGIREYLFLKAAELLNYDTDTSIAVGLVFTFLTILLALLGLFFEFSKNKIHLNQE